MTEEKSEHVRNLITLGKERGYLLYDEVNDLLPAEVHSAEEIEDLLAAIQRHGIGMAAHQLRLKNKRLSYGIEAAANLVPDSEIQAHQATLKLLRKAQRSLGQLNDDTRRRSLAAALGEDKTGASHLLLKPKQKKLLLRKATEAYDELADVKPLKLSSA